MTIPERDWKTLRRLHEVALQRLCERILNECQDVIGLPSGSPHDRYLQLWELLTRNRELVRAFDDLRRSTALHRLFAMRSLGVVTDEELATFSPETRDVLARLEDPDS